MQRWTQCAMALLLVASFLFPAAVAQPAQAATLGQAQDPNASQGVGRVDKPVEEIVPSDFFGEPIYQDVKTEWDKQFQPTTGVEIKIPGPSYSAAGGAEGLQVQENFQGKPGPTLLWTVDDGWVEWDVEIPQSGLYEITVDYYPIPGKRSSVQRDLLIDGALPFREAKRIVFQRVWKDSAWPPKRDNRGNDMRPAQVEAPQWETKTLEDADGRYEVPFQFAFTAGSHKLQLRTVREPIAIHTITIHSPKVVPTYEQRLAEWQAKGYRKVPASAKPTVVEAELVYLKSDPTIRAEVNFDALASPYSDGLFRLNSFGGWRWRLPGQWVRWKINVPEDGLYEISMDVWQGWAGRKPRIRTLKIDGEIPFQEMRNILFRSDRLWRMETLRPEQLPNTEPYLYYLSRGEHILQMEINLGFMAETMRVLDQTLGEMSAMSREMVMVTGSEADVNMEWDLHEKIPTLVPRFKEIIERLNVQARRMEEIGKSRNETSQAFYVVTDQMQRMVDRPAEIHRLLDDYTRSQGILAAQMLGLLNHPLQVEWIMIHSPDIDPPRAQANMWEMTVASARTFIMSFFRDYTGLGSTYGANEKPLEVWVGRGTEWGQIMKDMIEDDFTPNTGINVNLHIIPPGMLGDTGNSVLLLAVSSGEAPDVAVGVQGHLPVDFAVRRGLVNLNEFPDYPQVAARFRPGALVPFRYRVPFTDRIGDWAIPETQDFAMLFYRTDVTTELGLTPPDTWDQLYDALLKLQQNGLDFYYPPPTGVTTVAEGSVGFTPFLFQNGGDFYRCNEEGSCRSSLDTPEALAGFMEWTELYSSYKIPREANFFTRMRTGEQPIGVANYYTYIQLSTAAPELTGRWEMRPMPGHRCGSPSVTGTLTIPCPPGTEPGTVVRTSGGTGQAAVIFNQSTQKEAAWEFVKWWTGKDAQQRFGGELEALIGVEARWNTANLEALQALPWPKRDIANIMEQWRWFREPPVVLGGYFTGRHVLNAWNRVVLQGVNPREALEDAIYDINKELAKKQEEFGVEVDPSMYRRGG
ncbi:MAG TPA: extracellular solute-binding protein [Chloroflexota bacterium]|nr:extracellular solute-binding protein [Chloroflexota bacterium]